jgi:hypothetical protein
MTEKQKPEKPSKPETTPTMAISEAEFRKGGYQPIEVAPANPTPPSKPGTPSKQTSEKK